MPIDQLPSPVDHEAQTVVKTDTNYTVNNNDNAVDVIAPGVTIRMPPKPLFGERHVISASGFAVTLNGNGFPIEASLTVSANTGIELYFSAQETWIPLGSGSGGTGATGSTGQYAGLQNQVLQVPLIPGGSTGSTGVAIMMYRPPVSILDFEGVDPTGGTDQATVFEAAFLAIKAQGGGTLYVPTGRYLFETHCTPVDMDNCRDIIIRGDGESTQILPRTGTLEQAIWSFGNVTGRMIVEQMAFLGTGNPADVSCAAMLAITSTGPGVIIRNCIGALHSQSLAYKGIFWINASDVSVQDCQFGGMSHENGAAIYATSFRRVCCTRLNFIDYVASFSPLTGKVEYRPSVNLKFLWFQGPEAGNTESALEQGTVIVQQCRFDEAQHQAITVEGLGGENPLVQRVLIEDCDFNVFNGTPSTAVQLSFCDRSTIQRCRMSWADSLGHHICELFSCRHTELEYVRGHLGADTIMADANCYYLKVKDCDYINLDVEGVQQVDIEKNGVFTQTDFAFAADANEQMTSVASAGKTLLISDGAATTTRTVTSQQDPTAGKWIVINNNGTHTHRFGWKTGASVIIESLRKKMIGADGANAIIILGESIAPVLTSLNFDLADTLGGCSITITGTDLGGAASCTVGGTAATITGNTTTTLTFTMPAKAAGSYPVQVTTSGGASNTLPIEAWNPGLEPTTTLFCEQPDYVSGSPGVGSWTTRVGVAPSSATTAPAAAAGAPDYSGGGGQQLLGANMNTLVTIPTGSLLALTNLDTAPAAGGLFIDDPAVFAMLSDGDLAMGVNGTGLRCGVFNAGFTEIPSFGGPLTGATHMLMFRWGGGVNIDASVDGGTVQQAAAPGPSTVTALSVFGSNYNATKVLDGRIIVLFAATGKVNATFVSKFKKWSQVRHGLA